MQEKKNQSKLWFQVSQVSIANLWRHCLRGKVYAALLVIALATNFSMLQAEEDNLDPRLHPTGALTLSEEQKAHIQNTWPRILAVRPNKYGAARIEQYMREKGYGLIGLDIAATADNEFITNKNVDSNPEDYSQFKAKMATIGLPAKVDNSKLACFPPIGDQRQLGSCVGWASTYYHATHEYGLLNGINNKTNSDNILSPKWTYNMINNGKDQGSLPTDAYELLKQNGAAPFNDFPYDTNYTAWDLDTQDWIKALSYRMGDPQFITIDGPEDIEAVKQVLNNGHILTFVTYAYSWQFTKVKADPSAAENPYAGQQALFWMNGQSGGHHLSIVGYDDNVWIDVNNNGQVDAGEKGAFLIANSWGSWANNGYIWVAYDAFYKRSVVPNGPSSGRLPIAEMIYSIVAKKANYTPKAIAKFSLTQAARNQLSISLGVSDVNATTPTQKFVSGALTRDGGALAFNGQGATNQTATFALDLTDLLPTSSANKRFYLIASDVASGNQTTVNSFSLVDLVHNREVKNAQTPLNVDGSTIQPFVDYQFSNDGGDVIPPSITITAPTGGSVVSGSISVTANVSDNVAVDRVEYFVDAALKATDSTAPYVFNLDTTSVANGQHIITAVAYDTSGNSSKDEVTITVQNSDDRDTEAPKLTIASPSDGSTVSGTITLSVTATDNIGVDKVEYYVDGALLTTDKTQPYQQSIDTTTLSNGKHTIKVIAYDKAGNTAQKSVTVTVQNKQVEVPSVFITAPANGATVSGTVNVTVNAKDNKRVARVQLYVDCRISALDFIAPYNFLVDTTKLSEGQHSLTAIAYDDAGNFDQHTIIVVVKNKK